MTHTYDINYEFCFADGPVKFFKISLDPRTLSVFSDSRISPPEWARLEFHQCQSCPLTAVDTAYCPICRNIAEIVEAFKSFTSYDRCLVRCTTSERIFSKETDVQEGLSSILGIFMATSDCPRMHLLKPMARFHLPFATSEETIIRSTSFFLLRQYFESLDGKIPTIDLQGMDAHYREIQRVNAGILDRIKAISSKDADRNAIIILNSLAELLILAFDSRLGTVKKYFQTHENPSTPEYPPR